MPGGLLSDTLNLSPARHDNIVYIQRLLQRNDLPDSDLDNALNHLFIVWDGSDKVGIGDLELSEHFGGALD